MSRAVFDTGFFVEHYYSSDGEVLGRTKEAIRRNRERGLFRLW